MPPFKATRKYEKKSKSVTKSVDAVNALFAQNLTKRLIGRKRKKPKIKIPELPPRTAAYATDDSLRVSADDTFDKVLKGAVFNEVKLARGCAPVNSSASDASLPRINRTASPVTESLCVEKAAKSDASSLSYIHLPAISEHISKMESSYEPLFSRAFREEHAVISSTPCAPAPPDLADSISPIAASSNLIAKSYDVIQKWDSTYPASVEGDTPKRLIAPARRVRKRKSTVARSDWKLAASLRVCIKACEVVDVKRVDPKLRTSPKVFLTDCCAEPDFKGFDETERYLSEQDSNELREFLESESSKIETLPHICGNSETRQSRKRNSEIERILHTCDSSDLSASFGVVKRKRGRPPKNRQKTSKPSTECSSISYSTAELTDGLEVSLNSDKNKSQSLRDARRVTESKNLVVSLSDFDSFEKSVISVSSDSSIDGMQIVQKFSNFAPKIADPRSESLDATPSPKANYLKSGKIVVLSDIQLSGCKARDVWHDHSYSNSPMNFFFKYPQAPRVTMRKRSSHNFGELLQSSPDVVESSVISSPKRKAIALRPGKSYRRSLSLLRKSSIFDVMMSEKCPESCICPKCLFKKKLRTTRVSQMVPADLHQTTFRPSALGGYARTTCSYVQEELAEPNLDDSLRGLSLSLSNRPEFRQSRVQVTAKEIVLRKCGQTEIQPFDECYPASLLQNCHKIGEGLYGEVFLRRNPKGGTSVMKIIPIEGDLIVNGEKQKKYEEIVSEIVIAKELSDLRLNKKNCTSNFSEVQSIRCVQGRYPDRLLELWELYDEMKSSENDSPQIFQDNQQYIVLELANGGKDLESYVFNNAQQAFAIFKQTACALAVAESQLKFEHRDLHWGNILVNTVEKDKTVHFRLNGKEINVETHGTEAAIIDFTLSRVEVEGVVIFNDLSQDQDLFVAKGDYQFEIYRLMQQTNGNEWQRFKPFTNILWLHYLLDKAVTSTLRYKNIRSRVHNEYMTTLKKYQAEILEYESVVDFVNDKFVSFCK